MLAGEQTLDEIMLNTLRLVRRATASRCTPARRSSTIDRAQPRWCVAEDGTEAPYDRLLLATGSNPFILPVPGKDLPGVIAYRDIADTERDDRGRDQRTATRSSSAAACSAWKRPTA